jgi:hypothetical protein
MSSEPDCVHVLKDASQLTLSQKQRKERCTILPTTDELHPWADPIGGRAWTRLLRNPALHIAKEKKHVARRQHADVRIMVKHTARLRTLDAACHRAAEF